MHPLPHCARWLHTRVTIRAFDRAVSFADVRNRESARGREAERECVRKLPFEWPLNLSWGHKFQSKQTETARPPLTPLQRQQQPWYLQVRHDMTNNAARDQVRLTDEDDAADDDDDADAAADDDVNDDTIFGHSS